MAILLSVVFGLLVYPIHVAGLTLCDTDGTLEVVESTASNVFTCTGADSSDTITWILQRSNGNTNLATCIPDSCNNPIKPQFEASRPAGDRSTLTVNGSTTSYLQSIQGQTIVCRADPKAGSPQQTQCTVDIVAVPSVTCDAHYNTGTSSPWTLTVNCSVSGAYSDLNRYTCNLIQTSPTTNSLGSGNLVVTSTSGSGGKYKTGYCQVTVTYPDVTSVYSYKMAVTPGRQDVPASFGVQSSLEITVSTEPEGEIKTEPEGEIKTEPEPDPEPGFPVGVVVGVVVAVVDVPAIIVMVVVVIRQRRGKRQNPASPTQAEMSHEQHNPRQPESDVYEIQDNGLPNNNRVVGSSSLPSDYESLQTSDMGQRSVYSSLSSPDYNAGAAGNTGPSYVNNSETDPVYAKKDNAKTDPVYVNKDNATTDHVYVNKDNAKTDPVYVNKDNAKTDPVYVNKEN